MHKYTLQGKLADGGYSSVYKCTNTVGTPYVCKMIHKEKSTHERVKKEVDTMEKLGRCVYTPRLIDYYENDVAYYIIQEYCRGVPLEQKQYDEFAANYIIRELLRGLYDLHETGIIHCDIKQGNVIYNKRDHILKIIDFGNSQFGSPISLDKLVGTPLYMAPEQLCHTCTFQTDIWSVGVMLHHMLGGVLPFDTYKEIFSVEPQLKGFNWHDTSEDAKDFIRTCLHKDYHKRPTVQELLTHPWISR